MSEEPKHSNASNEPSNEGVKPFAQEESKPGASPELIASAKNNYGFTDEQINSFPSEDALNNAMLQYDQQILQTPGQAQPGPFPAAPAQQQPVGFEQQQYQQQPGPQQQQQEAQNDRVEFPKLDPEDMDATTYQAMTALQQQYEQMNNALSQLSNQWQAYETQNYVSQFQPAIDKLNDGRFSDQNPNYAHNMFQLLDTAERLNEGRRTRGLAQLSNEDAVMAAYRHFQQINGGPSGMLNNFIGQPNTSQMHEMPGDAKALRTIERHGFGGGGVDTSELLNGFPE